MTTSVKRIEWLTTAPNLRVRGYGADDGQRGWKLHAIEMGNDTISYKVTLADVRYEPALCGLRAAHGWGVDLFIEDKCQRCTKAVNRLAEVA